MMCHFKKNSSASVKYRLFAHFPNQSGSSVITAIQLAEILKSKNKDFQKYIHELIGFSNFAGFLARFELYFGPSIDELIADIQNKLVKNGMPEGERPAQFPCRTLLSRFTAFAIRQTRRALRNSFQDCRKLSGSVNTPMLRR